MAIRSIDRKLVTRALEDVDQDPDEVLRGDYSGRGMFGEATFGIVGTVAEIGQFYAALGYQVAVREEYATDDSAADVAVDDVFDLIRAARSDDMGVDKIVYFPGWQLG